MERFSKEKKNNFKKNFNQYKNRQSSSIYNIRLFHNWIKRELLKEAANYLLTNYNVKKIKLLDLAVGKGGDIQKWYDLGIMEVVGFDINDESINGKFGAKHRYDELVQKLKRENKQIPNYNFYVFDLSDNKNVSEINKILNNNKFDIISCQFAIHYFFKNETSLNSFIEIINNNKSENSFFIGTTMNGDLIKK